MHVKKGSRERSTAGMLYSLKAAVTPVTTVTLQSLDCRHNCTSIYSCKATLDTFPLMFYSLD